MKIGDIVEVHIVHVFGADRWVGARVVSIGETGFGVEALTGVFDADGHTMMMLRWDGNSSTSRQWR